MKHAGPVCNPQQLTELDCSTENGNDSDMDEDSSVSMSNEDDCIEENFSDDSNDMADNSDEDNTSECLPLFQDSSLSV